MLLHQLLTDDEKKLIRPYLKDDEDILEDSDASEESETDCANEGKVHI